MIEYKTPLLILAAEPNGNVTFPGFFEIHEGSAKHLLENPPYLRYMGWNMLTLDNAKIRGGFWEVTNGERKKIRLYRDGSLVALAYADDSFLGWGKSHEEFLESPELNTLALMEYIFEFTNSYKEILKFLNGVESVRLKAALENVKVNDKKLFLIPRIKAARHFDFVNPREHQAEDDFFTEDVIVELKSEPSFKSEHVAAGLLQEIFAGFGVLPDEIPLITHDEKGQRVVDISQIKSIQ